MASKYSTVSIDVTDMRRSRRVDYRTRRDRTETQNVHWNMQMDNLVNAYLQYSMWDEYRDPWTSSPADATAAPGIPLPSMDLVDIFCEFLTDSFHRHHSHIACA
jgi:hypothetical protein